MTAPTVRAYLEGIQDERFETRMPSLLKRHAETVARAKGTTLSQYVLAAVAASVSADILDSQALALTPSEQVELVRVLAAPSADTPALRAATARARELFRQD
jgi:uncharacterized protein (DUF1778 family)